MDYNYWSDVLKSVLIGCGLGAFIDFYIGKKGQEQLKSRLEDFWIRTSYVKFGNFGQKEAYFTAHILRNMFGKKTFSLQRILSSFTFCAIIFALITIKYINLLISDLSDFVIQYIIMTLIIVALSFYLSISVTILIVEKIGKISKGSLFKSFAGFCLLILFQYMIFVFLMDIVSQTNYLLSFLLIDLLRTDRMSSTMHFNLINVFIYTIKLHVLNGYYTIFRSWNIFYLTIEIIERKAENYADVIAKLVFLINLIPNISRTIIGLIFVLSFVVKPLHGFIMVVWARIIESDKPIFTMLCGGIVAFVKMIQELIKV